MTNLFNVIPIAFISFQFANIMKRAKEWVPQKASK